MSRKRPVRQAARETEAEFQARAAAASAQYASRTIADMIDVAGQEAAKRALEIAVAGGHTVTIDGPEVERRHLTAGFLTIGGAVNDVTIGGELYIKVGPTSVSDILLPCPAEPSRVIKERALRAASTLIAGDVCDQLDYNGEQLLKLAAERCRAFDLDVARRVARTIAALDGKDGPGRIHVAEALAYQNQHPG